MSNSELREKIATIIRAEKNIYSMQIEDHDYCGKIADRIIAECNLVKQKKTTASEPKSRSKSVKSLTS